MSVFYQKENSSDCLNFGETPPGWLPCGSGRLYSSLATELFKSVRDKSCPSAMVETDYIMDKVNERSISQIPFSLFQYVSCIWPFSPVAGHLHACLMSPNSMNIRTEFRNLCIPSCLKHGGDCVCQMNEWASASCPLSHQSAVLEASLVPVITFPGHLPLSHLCYLSELVIWICAVVVYTTDRALFWVPFKH